MERSSAGGGGGGGGGGPAPAAASPRTVVEETFVLHLKQSGLVRDRRSRLRKQAACFPGSDLVSWLCRDAKARSLYFDDTPVVSREEAVAFATRLFEQGAFHHVSHMRPFSDSSLLYRLRWDEPDASMPSVAQLLEGDRSSVKAGYIPVRGSGAGRDGWGGATWRTCRPRRPRL